MTTVTVFTAERMAEIEAQAVVGGEVVGDNLILERHNGVTFDAGVVVGPAGADGDSTAIKSIKTLVIASSEAEQNSKDTADYLCDGINDEEEILAALIQLEDAGAWGVAGQIVLTEGTFYIDLTVSNETIELENIIFRGQSMGNTIIEIVHPTCDGFSADDCVIQDIGFYDNESDIPTTMLVCSSQNVVERCTIQPSNGNTGLESATQNVIRDCLFYYNIGTGVCAYANFGGTFQNCVFNITGGTCVRVYAPEGDERHVVKFLECRFNGFNTTKLMDFFDFGGGLGHGANCLISNCGFLLLNTASYAIYSTAGNEDDPCSLAIVNSTFSTGSGSTTGTAISLNGDSGALIQGNRFLTSFANAISLVDCYGAKIIGNIIQGPVNQVVATTCHQISVENNTFYGLTEPYSVTPAVVGQIAIQLTTCEQCYVVDNQLRLIGEHGIVVTSSVQGYIGQNFLWRCGLRTDNTYSGIKLVTCDDFSVLNNRITNVSPAIQLKYGIEIGAGCDRTYVQGNHIYASTDTAAIQDGGTSTDTTSANKIT